MTDIFYEKIMFNVPTKERSLLSKEEKSQLSSNVRDLEYIYKYKQLQIGISPSERAFVLTPRQLFEIGDLLPRISDRVEKVLGLSGLKRAWDHIPIISILSKALLEESTKYSTWISKRIAQRHHNDQSVLICDMCSGAGITTSKVYIEFKNRGIPHVQIHAIDNSIESISAAYLLFQTQNIPCQIVTGNISSINHYSEFDGILLIYSDIENYMTSLDKRFMYNDLISENGISYLPKKIHDKIFTDSIEHLRVNAAVYLSSINPNYTVQLSKPFLIQEILTGKNKHEKYHQRIVSNKKQYITTPDNKIRKAMTEETGRQIEFMRNLLLSDFTVFVSYMNGLNKATKAAKSLKDDILSPVCDISNGLKLIFNKHELNTYPDIVGSPCDAIEILL